MSTRYSSISACLHNMFTIARRTTFICFMNLLSDDRIQWKAKHNIDKILGHKRISRIACTNPQMTLVFIYILSRILPPKCRLVAYLSWQVASLVRDQQKRQTLSPAACPFSKELHHCHNVCSRLLLRISRSCFNRLRIGWKEEYTWFTRSPVAVNTPIVL